MRGKNNHRTLILIWNHFRFMIVILLLYRFFCHQRRCLINNIFHRRDELFRLWEIVML